MRRLLATVTTAAVLVGGAAAAGTTDPAPGQRPDTAASAAGQQPDGRAALRRRVLVEAVGIAAETIGIEPSALVAAVRSGTSTAEVATEHGVDPHAVVDALVAAANGHIDEAVAGGRLDEGRAAHLRERIPEVATRLVEATRAPATAGTAGSGALESALRRRAIMAAVRTSAQTIGVPPSALIGAYRDGRSVGEVATEHGVDPQAVVDALVAAADERIDRAVAGGRLGRERATRLGERVPGLAERFVGAHRDERA